MVQAVLFDLDGTLVDSREAVVWAVNELVNEIGRPPIRAEEVIPLIGVGLVPLLGRFVDKPESYVGRYRDIYKNGFQKRTSVYRGAKEVLRLLKEAGVRTGIATNRSRELSQVIVDYFGLGGYLDSLVGQGGDNSYLKPDPKLIFEACRVLEVDPKKTIMAGDTEIDVETGRNAGCFTIEVDHEAGNAPTEADAVVYELPEILKFLDAV